MKFLIFLLFNFKYFSDCVQIIFKQNTEYFFCIFRYFMLRKSMGRYEKKAHFHILNFQLFDCYELAECVQVDLEQPFSFQAEIQTCFECQFFSHWHDNVRKASKIRRGFVYSFVWFEFDVIFIYSNCLFLFENIFGFISVCYQAHTELYIRRAIDKQIGYLL